MKCLILEVVTLVMVLPHFAEGKMNVLFLGSDDMKPEIGNSVLIILIYC